MSNNNNNNNNNNNEEEMLRKQWKPNPSNEEIIQIVQEYYFDQGQNVQFIKELDSYDDKNIWIKVDDVNYLVKIHNGVESKDLIDKLSLPNEMEYEKSVIHLQNTMMTHLNRHDIPTNQPQIHNKDVNLLPTPGSIHELSVVNGKEKRPLVVRVLSWISGRPMSTLSMLPLEAIANAGRFLGRFSNCLQQELPTNQLIAAKRYHQWDGKNTCDLRPFTKYIQDDRKRSMVESIILEFQLQLIDTKIANEQFPISLIHGDFNDANYLVDNNFHITGVIDFGDSVESWKILDLTVAMAYAMLTTYGKQQRSLSAAAAMLRGYNSVCPVTAIERRYLVLLIACRLACSVSLGAYSYQQNPQNEYLLLHATPAWDALELIWGTDTERRTKIKDVIDQLFDRACSKQNFNDVDGKETIIDCSDLTFADPSISDPLENVRRKITGFKNNGITIPMKGVSKGNNQHNHNDSDSECDLAFATLDLTGVDFDKKVDNIDEPIDDQIALEIEMRILSFDENLSFDDLKEKASIESATIENDKPTNHDQLNRLFHLAELIMNGKYVDALQSESVDWLLTDTNIYGNAITTTADSLSDSESVGLLHDIIQRKMYTKIRSVAECVEAELLGIAALNLFLQLNYTGPTLDDDTADILDNINPHSCFSQVLKSSSTEKEEKSQTITARRNTKYHNTVLSELAVEGIWPCQVAECPYFLLLARCILSNLLLPSNIISSNWFDIRKEQQSANKGTSNLSTFISKLIALPIWNARSAVAHERLLLTSMPSNKLWKEVETCFEYCITHQIQKDILLERRLQASIYLEYGLACYHFEHIKKGKTLFNKAMDISGLIVEVTGSIGKRTKFQQKATAQMIVKAKSALNKESKTQSLFNNDEQSTTKGILVESQRVQYSEDSILFETVQYEDSNDNKVSHLNPLDQAILLALCLDVKNTNPADGLTAEEMNAYLARVLHHHDDWMVYSTALLERAWLEFEGNHTKERSILQMQALADQHTNRLTITQSTRKSIEESSPVQDRLRHLHCIVYPPRWQMLRDIAERYASLGIVTSAAEIFTEIEYWDEVVDCYRRAGKESMAENIVRERLEIAETPRMWMALGDLKNDPTYYEKAIDLSKGRFSQAYINLANYHFEKGNLSTALDIYRKALALRPLVSSVWFRVGTISMQLGDWETALTAFSEVVQQMPDEADAWANVAAVHMHNHNPAAAYPALVESLKQNRSNWRVWVSKLYTCLDLKKYDEAIQACTMLLDLKMSHSAKWVPDLEEKCIRAIVGGTINKYEKALVEENVALLEAERRSLNRVHELLERISAYYKEPWVFETLAYFHDSVGQDKQVFDNLMKEYRALTSIRAWEKDNDQVKRICRVVSQIISYQKGNKDELMKSKFLVSGVLKKIEKARFDTRGNLPEEVISLQNLFEEVTSLINETTE